jgi:putative colanic acid biosynthesis acetyltransferase WcaF
MSMMQETSFNMTISRKKFSLNNKILRGLWTIVYMLLFRPFPLRLFKKWRVFILRCFGAKVSWKAMVNASVKIWAPWNLVMGDYSCLGPHVDCYNQGMITIGSNTTISQKSYLCASTHDYTNTSNPLILKPITIEDQVWVAADSFVGPGVNIKSGAVIGARSSVFKDVAAWTVVGGNPAKYLKDRIIN